MTHLNQQLLDSVQDRYGLALAARLSDSAETLPHDITERLRAARVQAVARRKLLSTRTASVVSLSGGAATLSFGEEGLNLWNRLASMLPLLALVAGLVAINLVQNHNRASELADVDTALLIDDLPPTAYTDSGFLQFVKASAILPSDQ